MELRYLRYFLAVASAGSFTRAAVTTYVLGKADPAWVRAPA